jgi:hypothetical protein
VGAWAPVICGLNAVQRTYCPPSGVAIVGHRSGRLSDKLRRRYNSKTRTPRSRVLLEKLTALRQSRNSPPFMEPEGSLPCYGNNTHTTIYSVSSSYSVSLITNLTTQKVPKDNDAFQTLNCRGSSVSTAPGYGPNDRDLNSQQRRGFFLFATASRTACGPLSLLSHGYRE